MKKLIKFEQAIINFVLFKSEFRKLENSEQIIINDILENNSINDNFKNPEFIEEILLDDLYIKFLPENGKKSKRIEVKSSNLKKERYCLMICDTAITIIIYGLSNLKEASGKMNLMIRR
ncbi:MAG: hypothetical protein ABIJ17_02360 [Patescibacteria group bacterium]